MPQYRFSAYDKSGNEAHDVVEAASPQHATAALRQAGWDRVVHVDAVIDGPGDGLLPDVLLVVGQAWAVAGAAGAAVAAAARFARDPVWAAAGGVGAVCVFAALFVAFGRARRWPEVAEQQEREARALRWDLGLLRAQLRQAQAASDAEPGAAADTAAV